jgi:hypothetical protein
MTGLTAFEQEVVDKLLDGSHPVLQALRRQCHGARLVTRQTTSAGFFCEFAVDQSAPAVNGDFQISDVHAELDSLAHGAGFTLFVRGGYIEMLEGYAYDEPWPSLIRCFSLRYSDPQRKRLLSKLG